MMRKFINGLSTLIGKLYLKIEIIPIIFEVPERYRVNC